MRARDNPFRTECVLRVRYRLRNLSWPEFLHRCEALLYRGAVVGAHGTGKTTLLEDLEGKLRERGFEILFLRLDAECCRFAPGVRQRFVGLTSRHIVFLDGAEQLDPLRWHWFKLCTRRAGGLIISVHKPGRLPTLWECRTSPILLAEIAGELLAQHPATLEKLAGALFRSFQGDVRQALRAWYDLQAVCASGESDDEKTYASSPVRPFRRLKPA